MVKSLNELKPDESGTVVEVAGGKGLMDRLSALGIRPGKRITKVSSMIMKGPVTIQVDRTQVALGFGMAQKILVDAERN